MSEITFGSDDLEFNDPEFEEEVYTPFGNYDVLTQILLRLSYPDVIHTLETNKQYYTLRHDESFWRNYIAHNYLIDTRKLTISSENAAKRAYQILKHLWSINTYPRTEWLLHAIYYPTEPIEDITHNVLLARKLSLEIFHRIKQVLDTGRDFIKLLDIMAESRSYITPNGIIFTDHNASVATYYRTHLEHDEIILIIGAAMYAYVQFCKKNGLPYDTK